MNCILPLVFIVASLAGLGVTCSPPTLPPGSRWVSNPNCTSGPNYNTLTPPRERCHCWGHCGYICKPLEDNGGSGSTTSTTTASTAKASPCAFGPIWYNPQGQRCYCQSHNQQAYYVCDSEATTPAPARIAAALAGKNDNSPCPFGGIWTNPKGQRCRCQSYQQQPYYVCESTSSGSSARRVRTANTKNPRIAARMQTDLQQVVTKYELTIR